MTTQAKTPTRKRTPKAAAAAEPAEIAAAPAPIDEMPAAETPVEAMPVEPVAVVEEAAPVVEEAPAPVEVAAPAVEPTVEAPAVAAPFAGFEMPKFDMPKFDMPKFEFPTFEVPKLDLPKFEMPKFDLPKLGDAEIPAALREFAEKAVSQAKANFDKMKVVAEEATDAIEDTYETTRAGVIEYGTKTIDAAKANSDATLGHAKVMLGVKTFAEAIELQTSFVRQQYEALSAQAKELQEMATKLAGDASKPAKEMLGKSLEVLKKD